MGLVGGGSTQVNCGGFDAVAALGAGATITNVTFTFLGSFQDSNLANLQPHQITFTGSSVNGGFGPFNTNIDNVVGTTGVQVNVGGSTPNVASIAAFLVTVTASNTVGSRTLPDNGSYTVNVNYTYEQQQSGGDVPEPTTLALVGGVLVLAGIRKFRK